MNTGGCQKHAVAFGEIPGGATLLTLCGNSPLVLSPPSRQPRPREAGAEFSPRQRPDLGCCCWLRAEPQQQQQPPLGRCCCCCRVGRPLHSWLRSREPPARQESALACRRATLPQGGLYRAQRGRRKDSGQVLGALSLARAHKPPWGCVSEPPSTSWAHSRGRGLASESVAVQA